MDDPTGRVLVVDDDPVTLTLCQKILLQANFAVTGSRLAEEALARLGDQTFDLILLDLHMPGLDGLELLAKIRQQNLNVPIVIITGTGNLQQVARAMRLGAQGLLLKPFTHADLLETVQTALRKRRAVRTYDRVAALRPLAQISQRLLTELDLPRLYDLIIATVRNELNADRASLMLWSEDQSYLRIAACAGLPADIQVGHRIALNTSLAGWVALNQQPLRVDNRRDLTPPLAEIRHLLNRDQLVSALSVPLRMGGQVLGVLNAAKTHAGIAFTEADQELLMLLAGQAAIAIENARLYNLAQRRADRLASLYRLSAAVTGSLDLTEIISTTLHHVGAALNVELGFVFLSDESARSLVQCAALYAGQTSPLMAMHLPITAGLVGEVLADGQPRVVSATVPAWTPAVASVGVSTTDQYEGQLPRIDNAPMRWVHAALSGDYPYLSRTDDPLATDETLSPEIEPSAWLCVALAGEQGICGAIEVLGRPGQVFGADDVQFMQALSTPVALAIEKARLYADVAASESRYRALLHHATDAVLLFDSRCRQILDANPAVEQLSGYAHHELVRLTPRDLIPQAEPLLSGLRNDNGRRQQRLHSASTLERGQEIETLLQTRDGRSIPVSLGVSQVPHEGQQLLLIIARDMSERQRIAQQLFQTEKLAAVGRLSASIAHEINNPLQALHNSLHLLINRPLSEDKRRQYLLMSQDEVERLISIVQRLIDFYRPSREGMRPIDLHEPLDLVLTLVHNQLEQSHVRIVRETTSRLPHVFAIANHIKQVYMNLILNAIEAMPDGGSLTIRSHVAEAAFDEDHGAAATSGAAGHRVDGPSVVIEFSDTGQGIPPHELSKIFEPFYTTRTKGTGLGLAISYSIIEQHHGELSVNSSPGQGTTFRIRLPVAR